MFFTSRLGRLGFQPGSSTVHQILYESLFSISVQHDDPKSTQTGIQKLRITSLMQEMPRQLGISKQSSFPGLGTFGIVLDIFDQQLVRENSSSLCVGVYNLDIHPAAAANKAGEIIPVRSQSLSYAGEEFAS